VSGLRALAAVTLLLLAACAVVPSLDPRQLSALDKGMAPQQAVAALNQPPLAQRTLPPLANGRQFTILEYRVRTGDVVDLYYLAFERDRLLYWGYPMEFRRQADRELAEALNQALGPPQPR
jgi:hypothetical protein